MALLASGACVAPAAAVLPSPGPTGTPSPTPTPTPVAANYQFSFSGLCEDCTQANQGIPVIATATLNLQNYVLGNNLQISNFISFTYNGTNLAAPFTLDSVDDIGGQLYGAGPADVFLRQGGYSFETQGLSDAIENPAPWQLFLPGIGPGSADYGPTHDWNVTLVNSGVPEPATWAMMIAGFAAIGGALRARRKATVRFA